jgi:prepilin-type N-terminal cleavage/methylation domain-containing protein/prepilin-type processing-associated H-X9-DG protein
MRCQPQNRPGFTLLELLVVVGILGVLTALLLPAVQKARAAAARAACADHLHNLGLAFHQHYYAYRLLPSNGGWDGKQTIPTTSGEPIVLLCIEFATPPLIHYWGIGEPGRPPKDQTGSWGYALLPFLEQQAMYGSRTWTLPLPVYNCPGRRPCTALKAPAKDEYATYPGGGWTRGKSDYAANSLVVPDRPNCLRLEDLTDGASNTLLAGEKAMDSKNYQTGTWFWDEPFFTGGAGGTARAGTKLLRDAPGIPFPYNWGSPHSGGAQFVLADGSVRLLPFGTPRRIVQALLTPAGGEVVPDPF